MVAAVASAWSQAIAPCLTGKSVASPAAYDAGEPVDAAARIDRDQPEHPRGGNARDARAAHERERDDPIGEDRRARMAVQPHVAAVDVGVLGADEVDARRVQRASDAPARRGTEELQRPRLWRDQRDAYRIAAVGRDQCGLIERE